MSTTVSVSDPTPEGPEQPRHDAARPGPDAEGRAGDGTVPAERPRYGGWAHVLAGMDCYGYGLGYDYWTALHGAPGPDGDPLDPRARRHDEAAAPRSGTGRTVALVVGGLVAAAAVATGLVLGLGGHSTTPAMAQAATATVPPAHPVMPPAQSSTPR
ncbi:hypothetical protein ACFQH9_01715 [Pseudonocardia lutea]|uniref:Uncharacterized protein n=1 Tax=Pseudonocardia lutea TaxID=2172015 RepID=A0ABW1I3K5_9PSEU